MAEKQVAKFVLDPKHAVWEELFEKWYPRCPGNDGEKIVFFNRLFDEIWDRCMSSRRPADYRGEVAAPSEPEEEYEEF